MTDKQIVIDGVNVSGCECYNPNIKMDCLIYPLQPDACKNNPNCHYKQLKRKEQECNKLKQTLAEIKEICKAESYLSPQSTRLLVHDILQKISECEVE